MGGLVGPHICSLSFFFKKSCPARIGRPHHRACVLFLQGNQSLSVTKKGSVLSGHCWGGGRFSPTAPSRAVGPSSISCRPQGAAAAAKSARLVGGFSNKTSKEKKWKK